MRIKFTFLEKDMIGIGVYKIAYETNIKMEECPAFGSLKDRVEERILRELGTDPETAKKDSAYSLEFVVKKKLPLGVSLPGEYYILLVTYSDCIKRSERSFQIQEDI